LLGALAFAAALNLGLLSVLVWSQSLPGWLLAAGWAAIGLIWLVCAWHGWWLLPKLRGLDASPEKEDLFIRAQLEYLNRHWLEAEELLATLLAGRDQDAEARLMLATLYRHTGRFAEADECLTRLERMDSGDRWCVEAGYGSRYCMDIGNGRVLEPHAPYRYVNHSCAPNCEFDFFDLAPMGESQSLRRVFLISLREIKPGEELTIDYNWSAETAIPCRCEAPTCRGWIVNPDQLEDVPARNQQHPSRSAVDERVEPSR
jgi:tetratricopeptide (TPR) repeat protein